MANPGEEAEAQKTSEDQEGSIVKVAAGPEQQPTNVQSDRKADELSPDAQGDEALDNLSEVTQEEAKSEVLARENITKIESTEQAAASHDDQDQCVTNGAKKESQVNENENVNGAPEVGQTAEVTSPQDHGENGDLSTTAREESAAVQRGEGGPVEEGAMDLVLGLQEGAQADTARTGADRSGGEHEEDAQGADINSKMADKTQGQVEEEASQATDEEKAQKQGEEGRKVRDGAEVLQPEIASEQTPGSAGEETEGHAGYVDKEDDGDQSEEKASTKDKVDAAARGGGKTSKDLEEEEEHSVPNQQTSASALVTTASRSSARSSGDGPGSSRSGSGSQDDGERNLTRLVERSSLEQQHRGLLLQRRQLLARNQRVQQRLSQHFSRKTDDAAERVEKNVGELEARYNRYLSGIREQQRFTDEEKQRRQEELAAFREQVEERMKLVTAEYATAVDLRRQVALKSRSSRTGRLMAATELEALIGREQQKEVEVQEARLESLRRETRLSRLEQTLRESEELAGGIHLIDFEQLKIENQTYAEKIEERNEDLVKLRRKISSTVQILTHLKERVQFEQAEKARRARQLQTVCAEVTQDRESLARLKQRRDHVRSRTASQRATAGLLGHEALLRDFEARVDEEARLAKELHALKREYAENQRLTQTTRRMVRSRRQQQGRQ